MWLKGLQIVKAATAKHRHEQNYTENPRGIEILNKTTGGFIRNTTINISHLLRHPIPFSVEATSVKDRSSLTIWNMYVISLQNNRHVCPELDRFLKSDKAYKYVAYKDALVWWPLLSLLAVTPGHRERVVSILDVTVMPMWGSVQQVALLQCNPFRSVIRQHSYSTEASGVQCLFAMAGSVTG